MSYDTENAFRARKGGANAGEAHERSDSSSPPTPQELLFETAIALIVALGAALAAQLFLGMG